MARNFATLTDMFAAHAYTATANATAYRPLDHAGAFRRPESFVATRSQQPFLLCIEAAVTIQQQSLYSFW